MEITLCRPGKIDIAVGDASKPPFDLKGKGVTRRVSAATAQIYAGEFVADTKELEEVASLRFGLDNVTLLCAGKVGEKRIVMVYAQSGRTWAKIAKWDNKEITLGNSVELADEELERAAIAEVGADTAAIVYGADGAGLMAVVDFADRAGTLRYTDLWAEEEPYNVAVSKLDTGKVIISFLLSSDGKARLGVVTVGATAATVGEPTILAAEYDTDEYSGAWSLAALSPRRAVVSYFQDYGKAVGFSLVTIEQNAVRPNYNGRCYYLGSLPATAVTALSEKSFVFCNGVTRTAPGAPNKTLLTAEGWYLTTYAAKPFWAGRVTEPTEKGISQCCAAPMGELVAMGYALDGTHYSALVKHDDLTPELYKPVKQVPGARCGTLIPLNGKYAMLPYQESGNGYVKVLGMVDAVIPTDGAPDGVAKSGGTARGKVNVVIPA